MSSYRVQRAVQLRSRRKAAVESRVSGGGSEETAGRGGISIFTCIVFLLCIGAGAILSKIAVQRPSWLKDYELRMGAPTGSAPNNVRSPPAPAATIPSAAAAAAAAAAKKSSPPTPPPVPPPPPAPPAPPVPTCTAEQTSQIQKQLPPGGCFQKAFTQSCSFTIATVKGGCRDNTVYYREPIAQLSLKADETFTAVLLGLSGDDTPMDLLSIGSHDKEKYSVQAWRTAASITGCSKPEVAMGETKQKARVLVVESDVAKALLAKRLKTTTGLTDEDFKGEIGTITSKAMNHGKTLNAWAQTHAPTGDVHFLQIASGSDANILSSGVGGGGLLERVWYVEFGYNWKDGWEFDTLKPLIDDTLKRFACYWYGTNGYLWRITGCWLDFYAQKHWSAIVCVNVGIEGAKPIYDKMEHVFQETLKRDLVMINAT